MSEQNIEHASVRARHTFRRFVQVRGISDADLPEYQAQARQVLEQYGNDYAEQWLQGWLDEAQADVASASQRQAERDAAMAAQAEQLHADYMAAQMAARKAKEEGDRQRDPAESSAIPEGQTPPPLWARKAAA